MYLSRNKHSIRTDWKLHKAWPWAEERPETRFYSSPAPQQLSKTLTSWRMWTLVLSLSLWEVRRELRNTSRSSHPSAVSLKAKIHKIWWFFFFFFMQGDCILLSLQLIQPWTTSDHLMKHREETASLKIHPLKETTWSLNGECSHYQHGLDLNDQRQAKIILKLSKCNHHRLCLGFHLPRGLPELSLLLKQHLITSCSPC